MMRKYALAMALLFIAIAAPTIAQTEAVVATERAELPAAAPRSPQGDILYYNLKKELRLKCTAGGADYRWSKNGTELELPSKEAGGPKLEANGAELVYKSAREDDYGNYSCSADGAAGGAWRVHARAVMRLPADSSVVEGQKLTLTCKPHGKPLQRVVWYIAPFDATLTPDNLTALMPMLTPLAVNEENSRFSTNNTESGVPDGQLVISAAESADAAQYVCVPEEGVAGVTVLRVKDMYAALWPFLGICAEVFVLCAVILLYEKRRTKPEMDDSDADAHDQ